MSTSSKGATPFSARQRALHRDLTRLLDERYSDLTTDELMAVVTRAMGERAAKTAAPPLKSWSQGGQRYFYGKHKGEPMLAIEPQSAAAFLTVQRDIKVNRATMVALPETLALNTELVVCVILSIVDLEIWYRGRVVHATDAQSALTLEPLSEQHATWWEVARRAFSSGSSQPSMPRKGPRTTPPAPRSSGTHKARPSSSSRGPRSSRGSGARRPSRPTGSGARSSRPLSRSAKPSASRPYSRSVRTEQRKTGSRPTRPPQPVDTGQLHRAFRTKKAKLGASDHFEMLDLHWSAFTALIERAYKRDMGLVRLENFPPERRDAVADDIKAIQVALKAAYSAILDEDKRRKYRATRVNAFQIQSAIELYLDKGNTALMRKDPKEAGECFRRVLELDPEHTKARSQLSVCKRQGA